jgi:hypothetical protein
MENKKCWRPYLTYSKKDIILIIVLQYKERQYVVKVYETATGRCLKQCKMLLEIRSNLFSFCKNWK